MKNVLILLLTMMLSVTMVGCGNSQKVDEVEVVDVENPISDEVTDSDVNDSTEVKE
jgi:hypothetical protein